MRNGWWDKRAGLPTGYSFGVLWWIGPTPKNACVVTQGKICQCPPAIAALNNPAQVPVKLIGPGATSMLGMTQPKHTIEI